MERNVHCRTFFLQKKYAKFKFRHFPMSIQEIIKNVFSHCVLNFLYKSCTNILHHFNHMWLAGNQAMQQVKAGLKAIYVSGWQTAADANVAGEMYPDQSLYPANSVPALVRNINKTLQRADQIHYSEGDNSVEDWFIPLVADAEAGFGGVLNAFEIMKAMIDAGASAIHFEDQLASVKKCGHMGGKVLVPTREAVDKLIAARLAADVMGVPSVIIARTDAQAANLLTSDVDSNDIR